MSKRYSHHARSVTRLRYHVILSTKYRKPISTVLSEKEVISLLESAVSKCSGVKLIACGFDKDHVHLVVDISPKWSVSQVVGRIKQLSTYDAWAKYADELSDFYWGKKRMLWSSGYFCESIGNVSEEKVLDYVGGQGVR